MSIIETISKKVALVGHHAVGKTSLISRFVQGKFPEKYLTTIGLKVDKKSIVVHQTQIDLIIWDIAGQEEVTRIPHYYLNGCHGFFYVMDLSRPTTYKDVASHMTMLRGIVPKAEAVLVGNKKDLIKPDELTGVIESCQIKPEVVTSAKAGEGVEEMFAMLAQKMISAHVPS
ncbi:MAG: Rab family GTPase [Bacteroidota bacterium]